MTEYKKLKQRELVYSVWYSCGFELGSSRQLDYGFNR